MACLQHKRSQPGDAGPAYARRCRSDRKPAAWRHGGSQSLWRPCSWPPQGQAERAVELYALAWRFPAVSNSRWCQDVFGQPLAAVAASLPPEVIATAQARGRARDVWATVQELLEELS